MMGQYVKRTQVSTEISQWPKLEQFEQQNKAVLDYNAGTSLVVQWLRIAFQCRGHEFDPQSGN